MVKTLLMLPNNPGDVLMATPAVRALAARGEAVHFLVDNDCQGLVSQNPHITKVHVFPRRKIKAVLQSPDWKKGVRELRDFAGRLNREKFDRVINLHQGVSMSLLSALLPAQDFAGSRRSRQGGLELVGPAVSLLYAVPFARRYAPAHASDCYTLMAGAKPDGLAAELFLPAKARAFADRTLRELNIARDKLVVLHPCTAHLKKEWPHEHAAVLLDRLTEAGYTTLITGSEREGERVQALLAKAHGARAHNLCGKGDLLESAALMACARALVSGDTVAMHMAAALKVKTLSIFAPTSPVETGPYAPGCTVFTADCLCYGNYGGFCPSGRRCTGHVTPENIFDEIEGRVPVLAAGCGRYVSGFDPATGLMDYIYEDTNLHVPLARALFCAETGLPLKETIPVSGSDAAAFNRVQSGISANTDRLGRLKASRNPEEIKRLIAENQVIERELSSLTGIGAYVSAVLRLRNNSVQEADLSALAGHMLENARALLTVTGRIKDLIRPLQEEPLPEVKALIPSRRDDDITEAVVSDLLPRIDYPGLSLEGVDDRAPSLNKKARETQAPYVLFMAKGVVPTPGFLVEMVGLLEREPGASLAAAKILEVNDTVRHAGIEASGRKGFAAVAAGLSRFDPDAVHIRELAAAEPYCALIRRSAFLATGGFEDNFTPAYRFIDLCLNFIAKGGRVLYCPDAEVYFQDAPDSKPPAAADVERDLWRLQERWGDLPLFNPPDPLNG